MIQKLFILLPFFALTFGCASRGMSYPGTTRYLHGVPTTNLPSLPSDRPAANNSSNSRRADRLANDISRAATNHLGDSRLRVGGTTFRYDCSGFVNAAHARAGADLANRNTAGMVEYARSLGLFERRGNPSVGDTVFFSNTHDRNNNRRLDDEWTHVAVVERVDSDDTLHLIHLGNQGVVRMVMNITRPSEHQDSSGKEINSFLRRRTSRDASGTVYLSGQLYSGTASFSLVPSSVLSAYYPISDGQYVQLAMAERTGCVAR